MSIFNNYRNFSKIVCHNKKEFVSEDFENEKKILIEFNNFCSDHIPLSYCANILKKKYKSNIYAYAGHVLLSYPLKQNIINKFKFFLGNYFGLKYFGVYKSFGTKKIFYPNPTKNIIIKAEKTFKFFKSKVKTLKDLEKFTYNKILIGDLLYDTYLKNKYSKIPTIYLHSEDFLKFASEFFILFEYWFDYIKNNKVKAIISSHSVYSLGILARIGLKNKIECFILTYDEFKRINDKHPRQGYEVKKFKKLFNRIPNKRKKDLILKSKQKISKRLNGNYSADYGWITKSPFGKGKNLRIKKDNKKIFVIATHDFVDGPHALGNSIYSDFYQWLINLCELSKKTDDIWLVKTHPSFTDEFTYYIKYEREVTKNILKHYPKVKLLDKDTTLNDLVKINVDAVFTVNGTIGFDFAILGINVINSSQNNPHINYKFNFHPKNEKELKYLILNFKKFKDKLKIKKKDLYEFYAMRNIYFTRNWFFKDLDETTKNIGSYHNFHKPLFYSYWTKNFETFDKQKTMKFLNKFLYSNKIFLLNNENLGSY